MNLNKIIFIFFLLVAGELSAQECKAKIVVTTDLATSNIYLNGNQVGKGNAELELNTGNYILAVMQASGNWNSIAYYDTLDIESCIDTTLSYSFKKQVYLNTDPQDVYVYEDSLLLGHTPLFIPLNSSELVLKKPGYESKNIMPKQMIGGTKITLTFTGEKRGESFFEKNVFKVLVGGIVALGGITAYFKLKADDNFDQYQSSGDRYYLDRTHKFDLISGVTFGALQLGLGFLIYHFLAD